MEKIFKGKIKHNILYSIVSDAKNFMLLTGAMGLFAFVPVMLTEDDAATGVIIGLFMLLLAFSYFYAKWYNARMQQWDKAGYEEMRVYPRQHYLMLDSHKMINFDDIKFINFTSCSDKLPPLAKSYDVVNAQMEICLKSGEILIFYVQQVSKIFAMAKYFRSLGFVVKASEFEHNPLRYLQGHYALVMFIFGALMVVVACISALQY